MTFFEGYILVSVTVFMGVWVYKLLTDDGKPRDNRTRTDARPTSEPKTKKKKKEPEPEPERKSVISKEDKEFMEKIDRLKNVPDENKKDELKRYYADIVDVANDLIDDYERDSDVS